MISFRFGIEGEEFEHYAPYYICCGAKQNANYLYCLRCHKRVGVKNFAGARVRLYIKSHLLAEFKLDPEELVQGIQRNYDKDFAKQLDAYIHVP